MLTAHPAPGLRAIVTGIYQMTSNGVVAEILAREKLAEALAKNPNGPVGLSCGCSKGSSADDLCGLGIIDCGTPGNLCPCQQGGGTCGGNQVTGLLGLGGLNGTIDDILSSVTSSTGNWQTWAMVGAGVLALVMLTGGGGSQRRAELTSARAQYSAKIAKIRAERPRRYQKYV